MLILHPEPANFRVGISPEEVKVIVQRVLRDGPFTLRELATAADVKYQTLRTWAAGLSAPRPDGLRQLADGLRKKSEELARLADEVERTADQDSAA